MGGSSKGRVRCTWRGCTVSGKQLCGTAFLDTWVLGIDGGTGRSADPGLHPEPGARRPAAGPDEAVALTGHRKVAPNPRAALATRQAALSGSQLKAPGSAGGYLHSRGRLSPHGLAESTKVPHITRTATRCATPSLRYIPPGTHFPNPSTRFPVGRIFLYTRRNFSFCKAHSRIRLKIQAFASWQLPCTYDHRN